MLDLSCADGRGRRQQTCAPPLRLFAAGDGAPAGCTHLALAAVALQLLHSLAQDWHLLLPAPQQALCMRGICGALAVQLSSSASLLPTSADDAQQEEAPEAPELTGVLCLVLLDPECSWLHRLAAQGASAPQFARAALAPGTTIAAPASSSSAQAPAHAAAPPSLLRAVLSVLRRGQQQQQQLLPHPLDLHYGLMCGTALASLPDALWVEAEGARPHSPHPATARATLLSLATHGLAESMAAPTEGHRGAAWLCEASAAAAQACLSGLASHSPHVWSVDVLQPLLKPLTHLQHSTSSSSRASRGRAAAPGVTAAGPAPSALALQPPGLLAVAVAVCAALAELPAGALVVAQAMLGGADVPGGGAASSATLGAGRAPGLPTQPTAPSRVPGPQALLSLAAQQPAGSAAAAQLLGLLRALVEALGHAAVEPATAAACQVHALALAKGLGEVLRQHVCGPGSGTSQPVTAASLGAADTDGSTQQQQQQQQQQHPLLGAALDLLVRLVCAVPTTLAVVDQSEAAAAAVAAHCVRACEWLAAQRTPAPPAAELAAAAGVLALSPRAQACLLAGGWLHQWLLAWLPRELSAPHRPGHAPPDLHRVLGVLRGGDGHGDGGGVWPASAEEQRLVEVLAGVQACLGWHGVARPLCLLGAGGADGAALGTLASAVLARVGGRRRVDVQRPLQFLVAALDPGGHVDGALAPPRSPALRTRPVHAAAAPGQDDLAAAAAPPGDLAVVRLVPELPLVALHLLSTCGSHPAALAQLDAATNVQWYLHHLLQCAAAGGTDNPGDTHALPPPGDLVGAVAPALLRRLRAAAPAGGQQGGGGLAAMWPAPHGGAWPEGAISSCVKADVGMADALGWMRTAAGALQADVLHGAPLDARALGLMLQRCVLVAWPGVAAVAAAAASSAVVLGGTVEGAWAGAAGQQPLPWQNVAVRSTNAAPGAAGADAAAEQPRASRTAQAMVLATVAALLLPNLPADGEDADGESVATAAAAEWFLPTCHAASLAAWVDAACSGMGCPDGADGLAAVLQAGGEAAGPHLGDAFLVVVGALLGAGAPAATPAAATAARGALELLQGVLRSPGAPLLWPALALRACGSVAGPAAGVCSALRVVLAVSEPRMWAALGGAGGLAMSVLLHHVVRWVGLGGSTAAGPAGGLAWCGVLPGEQVLAALGVHVLCGPDYLVYGVAAVRAIFLVAQPITRLRGPVTHQSHVLRVCVLQMLKLLEEDLLAAATAHPAATATWLATHAPAQLAACTWRQALPHMNRLCAAHRQVVLPLLLGACAATHG